jgi:hypothetical protein
VADGARRKISRLALLVLLFTGLFYLPSVRCGFFADDWLHRLALDQFPDMFRGQLNLFGMIRSTEEVTTLKRFGLVPWWTDDALRIDFWRPIPSFTHWLEYQLVGHSAVGAHLVNTLIYVLCALLVYRLLARFLAVDRWPLVVAVAVFALDDAHALNIVWSANRNETIGASFVLLSLLAFLRYRERRRWALGALCAAAYACALVSKESGIILPLFVVAHLLVFPGRPGQPLGARLRSELGLLVALFAVTGVFLYVYFGALGHGPNSAYYINPLVNPALWAANFFRSGFFHAVILVTGVPLHVLSITPVRDYPLAAAALGLVTLGFWALVYRWLRHDRPARFFVLTMLAGQAVVTTSFPDPRNLLLPSIGFAYVAARLGEEGVRRWRAGYGGRAVAVILAALHLVLAPVLCQMCIHIVAGFNGRYRLIADGLARVVDYQHLPDPGIEVYFLNWHQREMTALYGLYLRRVLPTGVTDYTPITENPKLRYAEKLHQGLGADKIHYYSLSYLIGTLDAEAPNDHEIVLRPRRGGFFPTLFEQLYTTGKPWQVGQSFSNGTHLARIEQLSPEGEVLAVRFTFPEPLASRRYRFMQYDGHAFVPVDLAALSGSITIGSR